MLAERRNWYLALRRIQLFHQDNIQNLIGQLPIKSPRRAQRHLCCTDLYHGLPGGSCAVAPLTLDIDFRFSCAQFQHAFVQRRSVSDGLQQRSVVIRIDAILPAADQQFQRMSVRSFTRLRKQLEDITLAVSDADAGCLGTRFRDAARRANAFNPAQAFPYNPDKLCNLSRLDVWYEERVLPGATMRADAQPLAVVSFQAARK